MTNIDQVNFENKRVVIRVDFNVPLDDNFNITDDTRMRAALPTINKVLNDKGMVVLMSHLGRPKKNPDPKFSIKPIIKHLEELLDHPVQFAEDCMKAADQVAAMKPGEVLVLENLRFYAEEEGKPRGIEKEDPVLFCLLVIFVIWILIEIAYPHKLSKKWIYNEPQK